MGWWKKHLPFPLIYTCVLITLWTVSRNRGWSCKHECNSSTLCCAWAWWTQVLRESETILGPRGQQGTCMLWEFAVALADSAMGRRDVCFSFSELLIKLMGKKKLLWRSGKSFVCQEGSLSLQILSCIISEIQVWLKDNEVMCYILHGKLLFSFSSNFLIP